MVEKAINEATKRMPLEKQYANFAQGLSKRLQGLPLEIWRKNQGQIMHFITANNEFAANLQDPLYQRIVQEEEKKMAGDITMGATGCIDGRFAFIFVGGRFMSAWEEPAGLIGMRQADDGKVYPQSTRLAASISANPQKEIFEVSFAHSAILPNLQLKPDGHHCGAMGTPELKKTIGHGETAQQTNLRLLDYGLQAITNQYNAARAQFGLPPIKTAGISAMFSTEDFGIILNYGKRNPLSTSQLTLYFANRIAPVVKNHIGLPSVMFDQFYKPENFFNLSTGVKDITKRLLQMKDFQDLRSGLSNYLKVNYPNLTDKQRNALQFLLIRNVAFQYMTGLPFPGRSGNHPFAEHNEGFMAISLEGSKTVGQLAPLQVFGSSPSTIPAAIRQIKLEKSIMDKNPKNQNRPLVLFVCNPVARRDYEEQSSSEVFLRAASNNANFLRTIVADGEIQHLVREGKLIMTPVFIDQNTREVLQIPNQSIYL